MNYLTVEGLTKTYNERTLFGDISLYIDKGQKVAFVAKNGTGKSSLMKIIAGLDVADSGNVQLKKDIRVSYLDQGPSFPGCKTVSDAVFKAGDPVSKAIAEYELAMEHPDDTDRMEKAFAEMDSLQAWDFEVRAKEVLGKLNVHDMDQLIDNLSGGQLKRVALAKVLIEEPDLLILDEPTNHLDLEMIEWLEEFLQRQNLTLFMVTHDRYFLDRVCTEIIELYEGEIHKYKGNYAYYLEKRAERQEVTRATIGKAQSLMKKELEWMRRQPKARTTKSKSRIDSFYEIKAIASEKVEELRPEITVDSPRLGSKILEFHHVNKSFGDLKILKDFSYKFKPRERIGIVGRNGVGKSTFLNMIMDQEAPSSGKIVVGDTVTFGYYTQDGLKIDQDKRVLDVVREVADFIPLPKGRTMTASAFLERFLFPPEQQYTHVHKLSGGEQRRLHLMRVLLENPNFLILDEPTNDLDIVTLNVLEEFLLGFPGCLIIVSHDRYFLDKLVDHVFVLEGDGDVKDFNGNYREYRDWKEDQIVQERKEGKPKPAATAIENKPEPKKEKVKLSYKEQKEYETLDAEIPKLEARKDELTAQLSTGTLSNEEIMTVSNELADLVNAIDTKTDRWLHLAEWI